MATLYRILKRLAIAWLVIVGGLSLLIMAHGGLLSDSDSWVFAMLATGVPTLLIGALAWIVKPPSSDPNAPPAAQDRRGYYRRSWCKLRLVRRRP